MHRHLLKPERRAALLAGQDKASAMGNSDSKAKASSPYSAQSTAKSRGGLVEDSTDTGIITIKQGQREIHGDPALDRLRQLPQFTPIIKKSLDETFRVKDLFANPRLEPGLDRMEPQSLVTLCLSFQAHCRRAAANISQTQRSIGSRMKAVEVNASRTIYTVAVKNNEMKSFTRDFREIGKLQYFLVEANRAISGILQLSEELRLLLPEEERIESFSEALQLQGAAVVTLAATVGLGPSIPVAFSTPSVPAITGPSTPSRSQAVQQPTRPESQKPAEKIQEPTESRDLSTSVVALPQEPVSSAKPSDPASSGPQPEAVFATPQAEPVVADQPEPTPSAQLDLTASQPEPTPSSQPEPAVAEALSAQPESAPDEPENVPFTQPEATVAEIQPEFTAAAQSEPTASVEKEPDPDTAPVPEAGVQPTPEVEFL